ncbi:MAG: DNA-directed DNA polymerase [archaeon]
MKEIKEVKGILLDLDYHNIEGKSVIRVYVKTSKGIERFEDKSFKPFFYALTRNKKELKQAIKLLPETTLDKEGKKLINAIKEVKKNNYENVLKLEFDNTTNLVQARKHLLNSKSIKELREYDILFVQRYLTLKNLEPTNGVKLKLDQNNCIKEIKTVDKDYGIKLNLMAFDIEVLVSTGFPNAKKDEIIFIALTTPEKTLSLTTAKTLQEKKNLKVFENEKEMIGFLKDIILKEKIDVLITYNGDGFDLPYLTDRAKVLGSDFKLLFESEPATERRGMYNSTELKGIQHFDVYQVIRFLTRIGAMNLMKNDLETVVENVFGIEKEKIGPKQMKEYWKSDKKELLEKIMKYNIEDTEYTLKLGEQYLTQFLGLSKLLKQKLFDASRTSTGSMVEKILINESFELKNLVPNKPTEQELSTRMKHTFTGAFVKEPIPGLHENIAILDFKSYHPSLLVSYNLSPEIMNCSCCKGTRKVKSNYYCKKRKGFIPKVVMGLLEKRDKTKKEMKKFDKNSSEYNSLYSEQWSYKIILNSIYGYCGFPGARWYAKEMITELYELVRSKIQETIKSLEKAGFIALYGDTDSCFAVVPKSKTRKELENFVEKYNKNLPGVMKLEFEGFYKRGIFVTKKEGGAAKKRYALIDFEGNLKIVGFEYVRRDWSKLAKETQKEVINAVLLEGKPEKAIEIVKKKIKELKTGKVKKKELIILTQLKRSIAKYENIGPHVMAAKKAIAKGKQIKVGDILEFIITKNGKSISDKAMLAEFVKEGEYDTDYYINNQLLPAVMKIIRELGCTEEDLKHGGKQQTLGGWN